MQIKTPHKPFVTNTLIVEFLLHFRGIPDLNLDPESTPTKFLVASLRAVLPGHFTEEYLTISHALSFPAMVNPFS
jgi:hypothetical protein